LQQIFWFKRRTYDSNVLLHSSINAPILNGIVYSYCCIRVSNFLSGKMPPSCIDHLVRSLLNSRTKLEILYPSSVIMLLQINFPSIKNTKKLSLYFIITITKSIPADTDYITPPGLSPVIHRILPWSYIFKNILFPSLASTHWNVFNCNVMHIK